MIPNSWNTCIWAIKKKKMNWSAKLRRDDRNSGQMKGKHEQIICHIFLLFTCLLAKNVVLPSFIRSTTNTNEHQCEQQRTNNTKKAQQKKKNEHTFIYIFMHIHLQERSFFVCAMIIVIINIMTWRHTFLARAQYMHTNNEMQTRS